MDLHVYTILEDLIVKEGACDFYVGNNGAFDREVHYALKKLKKQYPHIRYTIVLAYMPNAAASADDHTLFPEQVARAMPRFAIDKRNRWMLERADVVVTFVKHIGGAAKYMELAERKGKRVINLAQLQSDRELPKNT